MIGRLAATGLLVALALAGPLGAAEPAAQETPWQPLFDGKTLAGWKATNYGGEGEVRVEAGKLVLDIGEPLTGVTLADDKKLPRRNYEVSLEAMRVKGEDFFCGLTFPVGDAYCSFIVGGWAGTVCGISCINGRDASENETTQFEKFETGKWYRVRVRVTDDRLQAWVGDKQLVDVELKDKKLEVRSEVDLNRPFGLCSFRTEAHVRDLKIRSLKKPD